METVVIVDTSLAVKWVAVESDSHLAILLSEFWSRARIVVSAPDLMPFEAANALYGKAYWGHVAYDEARDVMANLMAIPIVYHQSASLHSRAMELAEMLGQNMVYDSFFLALAEFLDCEFWTADKRFYNAAQKTHPRIQYITEAESTPNT